MSARWFLFALLTLVSIIVHTPVFAFSVFPILHELDSVGNQARSSITATNDRSTRIGIDIDIVEIALDKNGQVVEIGEANDDFLIFPPQAIVAPNSRQVFRLQWLGDPDIDTSKTFLATVTEVPDAVASTNTDSVQASVSLALAFSVVINVKPIHGEPDIDVTSTQLPEPAQASSDAESNGTENLTVTFRNQSNVHGVLAHSNLTVELLDSQDKRLSRHRYSGDDVQRYIGLGLLPPNQSRTLSIPLLGVRPDLLERAVSAKVTVEPDVH